MDEDKETQFVLEDIAVDLNRLMEARAVALGLRESTLTPAELILREQDRGYIKCGAGDSALDMSATDRNRMVRMARIYGQHDSLSKQIVRLYTAYTFAGAGLTYSAEKHPRSQEVIDRFWKSRANRWAFSGQGQWRLSDRLQIDGELFLVLFVGSKPGDVKVRQIDPLQIVDIATDPDDEITPRYYIRKWTDRKGTQRRRVYRDWTNLNNEDGADAEGNIINAQDRDLQLDPVIYHVTINSLGLRGNTQLSTVMQWSKAHRQFIRARLAYELALTMFAWDKEVAGGQKAVDTIIAKYQSTYGSSGEEDRPPPAPGSTYVHNPRTALKPHHYTSGAGDAQTDANMLIMMVGVGACVFPHYLGAGEAFRLATAKAMEAPMLKNFLGYRRLWIDTFEDVFGFVLERGNVPETDRYFDVSLPPIMPEDIVAMATVFEKLRTATPDVFETESVQKRALGLLGIKDVDEVLKQISGDGKEPVGESAVARLLARELNRMRAEVRS